MIVIYFFLFGLCMGSFLNVCIYRLPQGDSIAYPPSHCMHCQSRLQMVDLIPVLSYLFLRGRCRQCGTPYSIRYTFVEILTGCLFIWCYTVFGIGFPLIKALILTSFLLVITYIDYDHQLILDKVLLFMAGAGALIECLTPSVGLLSIIAGSLAGGGLLLLIAIASKGGMGGGDIKLATVLGIYLGAKLTLLALFLSFVIGGVVAVFILLFKRKGRRDCIPFGPFIAAGAFLSLLYGQELIRWYWSLCMG
ncbi:prepilin peptidase [Propionispora vibrioides]|uniref:Leader peptidase (Prepilin peptidase) / N-methyltransferase n=1 Tax=Propionispora vibrioides TaxID=112903 RepID=A0A1H8NZQ9_9FIRM|nr:A24 family peptidase [Propionispora vibrioides]SEO35119.1 leader peptidase (prepilin peptidase) / N-methyltransferase [Propionispora vibrioides]